MRNLQIGPATPFLIVRDAPAAARFYIEKLGFESRVALPAEAPFFVLVGRDSLQLILKAVADDIEPRPNHRVHEWAPWDVFVHVPEPELLARDFTQRSAQLHCDVIERDDGLIGFEVCDIDGYRLFFGKPV